MDKLLASRAVERKEENWNIAKTLMDAYPE